MQPKQMEARKIIAGLEGLDITVCMLRASCDSVRHFAL